MWIFLELELLFLLTFKQSRNSKYKDQFLGPDCTDHYCSRLFQIGVFQFLIFLENFQIFRKISDFQKIFRYSEDVLIFGKKFRFLGDNNSNKDNPRTCGIWDTDYNSDNWEPEFMTIFVIWHLIVTLDSIRNSWDVF